MTKLSRDIRKSVHSGTLIPAIVMDAFQDHASIRLSINGSLMRNLKVTGGPVTKGDLVQVNFSTPVPIVIAPSVNGLTKSVARTITNEAKVPQIIFPQSGSNVGLPTGTPGGGGYPEFVQAILIDLYPFADWGNRASWDTGPAGLRIGASENYRALAILRVPPGYTGTITFYPWFSANGSSGNVYVWTSSDCYGWLSNTDDTTYVAPELDSSGASEIISIRGSTEFYRGPYNQLVIPSASYQYITNLYFYRTGTNSNDTFTGDINVIGFSLTFSE